MMNRKVNLHSIPMYILLLFVLFGCSHGFAQPLASVKETSSPGDVEKDRPTVGQEDYATATSSHWQRFIWEATPAEWLTDTNKRPIMEAYQQRNWKPFFIDGRFSLTKSARLFLARLDKAEDDAVDIKAYSLPSIQKGIKKLDQMRAALESVDPSYRDASAVFAEASYNPDSSSQKPQNVQYATVSPDALVPSAADRSELERHYRDVFRAASETDIRLVNIFARFAAEMNPYSKEKITEALTGAVPIEEFLDGLELKSPQYVSLKKAYVTYKRLAGEHSDQRQIRAGSSLRLGASGNEIREIQKRMQQEGFYHGKISGTFDSETQEAVRRFQQAHLIPADGAIGQKTTEWLNVTYERKTRMLAHSLRTARQSQTRVSDAYVQINIPQFSLSYYRDGKIKNTHRVIVGKASGKKVKLNGRVMGENQTPPISSAIEQVVVNPRWYITKRILGELADSMAADPNYFAKHGYVRTTSSLGEQRVFQLPGPTNPLGSIKFEFPNAYAVFLHDTPKKQLFQRSRRDFSHGCIRIEGARQLAQAIVSDDQNPAADKIDRYLEKKSPTHIRLNQPVPIVIEYLTATTDEKGHVIFYDDIYGLFKNDSSYQG